MAPRRYPDCATALAARQHPDAMACHDFRATREIVLCDAWQRFRNGQAPTFAAAVEAGWQDLRQACASVGGITPETGFLPGPPQVQAVRRAGRIVGAVVAVDDEAWVCLDTAGCAPVTAETLTQLLQQAGVEVGP